MPPVTMGEGGNHPQQLALNVTLRDSASFANFHVGDNAEALYLLQSSDEPFLYLWGEAGAGKTHLLHALCQQLQGQNEGAIYLPLGEVVQLETTMLEGMEQMGVLCLDGLEAIAGNPHWEEALFHLYNRVRDSGGRLIVTAEQPPASQEIQLPDLASRLAWGPVLRLHALDDEQRQQMLQQRAEARGLVMSREVASYLLRHYPRDLHFLLRALERLDRASLQAQRRLTVPFVRQVLDAWRPSL